MSYTYQPDYAVPPGEILQEELSSRKMTQQDLAERTGLARKTINEIVAGKAPISHDTAIRLERVFHQPARYWMNLEQQYRELLARESEKAALEASKGWLKEFPLKKMIALGWLPEMNEPADQVQALLNFFGIGGVEQWDVVWKNLRVAYRKSEKVQSSAHAISAWLRQGEIQAKRLECDSFDKQAFRAALQEIRALTRVADPSEFFPRLQELCCKCGVAVVLVPELPGMGVSGATYWLTDVAVIQLSLRYKSDDHLWFTFFHEAGHILLHGKKETFLEGMGLDDEKEQEANAFSARTLIKRSEFNALISRSDFSHTAIQQFASAQGISPGIVVGQLQHHGVIPFRSRAQSLKVRYRWSHEA